MSDEPTLEDVAALVAEVERHRLKVVCQPDVERLLREAVDRLGFNYPMPDITVADWVPEGTVYVFNQAAIEDAFARKRTGWEPGPPVQHLTDHQRRMNILWSNT